MNRYTRVIETYTARFHLTDRLVPFVFLFLVVITFGLLIPRLGLYWDDWPVIFLVNTQGTEGFWDFYQYDRPLSAWTYIVTTPLLGTNPMGWHIFSLVLRWLTIVSLWLTLRMVWPAKPRQIFWVSLLFAVFPIFKQQAVAVAYSQHWICYLFYFLSIYCMLLAQKHSKYFYPYTLLALFLSTVQMFTMEYFIGLELLRPFFLWIYYREQEPAESGLENLKQVIRTGWIYALSLGMFVIWRLFFIRLAYEDPNRIEFLTQLLKSPFQAIIDLLQKALQDLVYFSTAWFVSIRPADFDLHRPFFFGALLVVLIGAFALWIVLERYQPKHAESSGNHWSRQAILFGIIATLLGTAPVWVTGRQASLGLYGSRFGLAAMFGMSVFFVGIVEEISSRNRAKNLIICTLIGMAIFAHLYDTKAFEYSWEKQRGFYWQLYWRAPYIEPGTAFISDGEIFPYVGLYSTSLGIASLYPPLDPPQNLPYWFFSYWESLYKYPDQLISGTTLENGLRNYSFSGSSKNSLLIYSSPELNNCLWILSSSDSGNKDVPSTLLQLLNISNQKQIHRAPSKLNWSPPESIFGPEPEHQWCYYYQKAELASQYEDWDEVIRLMETADGQGYSPFNKQEYLPWVNAYLKAGKVDQAYKLTTRIEKLSSRVDDSVCTVWLKNVESSQSPELDETYNQVKELLSCFD